MSRLAIAAPVAATVEIDLYGEEFNTVVVTRTRQFAMEQIRREVEALNVVDFDTPEAAADHAVELLVQIADHLLERPAGSKKRTKPSKVLFAKWLDGSLNTDGIESILGQIAAAGRPT